MRQGQAPRSLQPVMNTWCMNMGQSVAKVSGSFIGATPLRMAKPLENPVVTVNDSCNN